MNTAQQPPRDRQEDVDQEIRVVARLEEDR